MRLKILLFALIFVSNNAYAQEQLSKNFKHKFGMLLTLSGNYAIAGEDQKIGINEALKAHPLSNSIEVVFADTANDPKVGLSEFNKMILVDKVTAVFINRAKIAIPLNSMSKKNKVPIVGSVGHDDFIPGNEYAFQAWPKASEEGEYLASKSIENGARRFAIIFAEDEYMTSVSKGFKDKVVKLGGEVVLFESILTSEFDVRSLIIKTRKMNPDTIYINVSVPQIAPIVKQIRELGINTRILSNFYIAKPEVLNSASHEIFEGIRYAEISTDLPNLKKSLGIAEKQSIPALTVSSYVGVKLLLQASSNSKAGESFYDTLLKQREVVTPDYNYQIESRYIKFPLTIKEIHNGNSIVVSRP